MPDAIIAGGDFSSQARYLFDRFTSPDGVANIRALVGQTPKETETNWLEFKSGKTREEDIKPLWSKALGSFANSGGGVVIWGIRAERDSATGIDAVQEEVPVPDAEKLAHKLRETQPVATDPPIQGVIVTPLLLPAEQFSGFVVCFIPESDSKPHRSEWGKNDVKRFNLRIGDSTKECPVPVLRQLFYPRAVVRAQLEIEAEELPINMRDMTFQRPSGELISRAQLSVSVHVRNTGPSSIEEPVLDLECGSEFVGSIDFNTAQNKHTFSFFKGSAHLTRMLHPRRAVEKRFIFGFGKDEPDPSLHFTLYARDLLPRSAKIGYNEITVRPWTKTIVPLLAPV